MDIEHLNKTQIVMLALLVSFVSSIATGIVTVSLVSQAPEGVTQTINRIVERTVEKVVTEPGKAIAAAASGSIPASTEKTVVVKEDDLAANSISQIQKSIVKIVEKGAPESAFYARGIIVDALGLIATDRSIVDPNLGSEAIFPNGDRVTITARTPASGSSVLLFEPSFIGTSTPKFAVAPLADISKLKLGQAVIRIGGKTKDAVSTGVISSLPDTSSTSDHLIETNVNATVPGGVLITLFGDVVGITTGTSLGAGGVFYTSASEIASALSAKTK
jgi:hypothetical protein